MLIGHLPAGYFTTKFLLKRLKAPLSKWWFLVGLIAAILPDFDIAYWVIFGRPGDSHRNYFSNYPFIYLTTLILCVLIYLVIRKKWFKYGIIVVFANIFVHFFLDTFFVGIKWLWPFYGKLLGVYNVNFAEGLLVDNYFHHWLWYAEIALWILAIISVVISYRKGEMRD